MKCGVGDYTAHLANALSRQADTAVAVLTDVGATSIPPSFQFEVFPVCRGWRISDVLRIGSAVRDWKPDVMHIQYPTQGYGQRYLPWVLPMLFRIAGVPVVQTWHGYDSRRMTRRLLPNSLVSGGLIVVRPEYMELMDPFYRRLNSRKLVRFIPNASTIPPTLISGEERAAIRARFCQPDSHLVVFFGFAYPDRGVELLFQVAHPARHHLVFISDLNSTDSYHRSILDCVSRDPWAGKATVTGYLPADEVGRILAAADAVILPFRDGAGMWNTSIRAALSQGTFVLTTSREKHGYDRDDNVYYARPDDVDDMRNALREFIGTRNHSRRGDLNRDWDAIAQAHVSLYETVAVDGLPNSRTRLVIQK